MANAGQRIHDPSYNSKTKTSDKGHTWIGPAFIGGGGPSVDPSHSTKQTRKSTLNQPHITGFSGQNMGHVIDPRNVGKINHNKSMSVSQTGMSGNYKGGPVRDMFDVPSQQQKSSYVQNHNGNVRTISQGFVQDFRDTPALNINKSMSPTHTGGFKTSTYYGPAVDPRDTPAMNNKSQMQQSGMTGFKAHNSGAVYNPYDVPATNPNSDSSYQITGASYHRDGYVIDPFDNTKVTQKGREAIIAGQKTMARGAVWDPTDVSRTTRKDQVNNNMVAGFGGSTRYSPVRDPNNTTRQSHRGTYREQNLGPMQGNRHEGPVLNPYDTTKTTQKGQKQLLGPMQGNRYDGPVLNPYDTTKTTQKGQAQLLGPMQGNRNEGPVLNPYDTTKTTQKGRMQLLGPMQGNRNEGPVLNPYDTTKTTQKGQQQNITGFKANGQGPTWDNTDTLTTTKRDTTSTQLIGGTSHNKQGVVVNFNDVPKNKQFADKNSGIAGFNGNASHGHVFDPLDVPKLVQKGNSQMMGSMQKSAYGPRVFDPRDQPSLTKKDTTKQQRLTGITQSKVGPRIYDPNNVTKITRKNQDTSSYYGQVKGPLQSTAYDPNDRPHQTKKMYQNNTAGIGIKGPNASYIKDPDDIPNQTQKGHANAYQGPIFSKTGHYLVDPDDVPKQLKKRGMENMSQSSIRITNAKSKNYVHDPLDVTKRTKKEQYETERRVGGIKATNQGIHLNDNVPLRTTRKDTNLIKNYVGNMAKPGYGEHLREQYNNANLSDVKTSPGRIPSPEGVKETPTNVFGTTQLKSKRKHAVTQVNSGYIDSGNFVLPNIYAI
jgi:hypothetical protein